MSTDTFANRLTEAMRIRGLTQTELAERTGFTQAAIHYWRTGHVLAKQNGVYQLAKALNVSEAWLMGADCPMVRVEPNSADHELRVALFGGDQTVTDEEWREVQQFVEYIKSKRGAKN